MIEQLSDSVKLAKSGKRPTATMPSDLPQGVALLRDGSFRLPARPAERADVLYRATELRLDLQRRVEKLKKLESQIEQYFIDTLSVEKATGIAGQVALVQVKVRPVPTVEDWPKVYAYIGRTKSFDLLQRRLNAEAVKERWEAKKAIPGVGVFNAKKVSCTRIK